MHGKVVGAYMKNRIRTREFSINDYDAAVELWKRVEGLEIAEGDDKASVARFLTRNPGLSRVATDAAAIIGVSLCGHDGRRGHIYHLAVDPRHHGVGLGKRLVQECFAGLRDAGIQRAIILVANDNYAGARFGSVAIGKSFRAHWRWERMWWRLRRQ